MHRTHRRDAATKARALMRYKRVHTVRLTPAHFLTGALQHPPLIRVIIPWTRSAGESCGGTAIAKPLIDNKNKSCILRVTEEKSRIYSRQFYFFVFPRKIFRSPLVGRHASGDRRFWNATTCPSALVASPSAALVNTLRNETDE